MLLNFIGVFVFVDPNPISVTDVAIGASCEYIFGRGIPNFTSWIGLEWGFPKKVHQRIVHTESTCIIYPDYITCTPPGVHPKQCRKIAFLTPIANSLLFIYLLYCEPTHGVFFCFTFLEL